MILEVKEFVQSISLNESVIAIDVRLSGVQGPQGIQGIQGVQGIQGEIGPVGIGISPGGNTGDVLTKSTGADYETTWENINSRYYTKQEIDYIYGPAGSYARSFILTQENLDTKSIELPFITTNPMHVKVIPEGGLPQVYGKDFEVVGGNILTWDSLGLDNFLEVSESLIIHH